MKRTHRLLSDDGRGVLTKYGGMNSLVSNSDFVTPSHLNMKLHETEMRLRERIYELEMQIVRSQSSFDRSKSPFDDALLPLYLLLYFEVILIIASAR
jgi:hypothetical protein